MKRSRNPSNGNLFISGLYTELEKPKVNVKVQRMKFRSLVESLAEKIGIEIADEGGAAAVGIAGLTILLHEADDDLLLLHADLGEIPAAGRDALAQAALQANFLYQGTGGATLAINPRDGHLHVQKYNWLDRLDPDKALDTLTRFADTSLSWQKLLADYSALNDKKAQDARLDDAAAFGGFMKV